MAVVGLAFLGTLSLVFSVLVLALDPIVYASRTEKSVTLGALLRVEDNAQADGTREEVNILSLLSDYIFSVHVCILNDWKLWSRRSPAMELSTPFMEALVNESAAFATLVTHLIVDGRVGFYILSLNMEAVNADILDRTGTKA